MHKYAIDEMTPHHLLLTVQRHPIAYLSHLVSIHIRFQRFKQSSPRSSVASQKSLNVARMPILIVHGYFLRANGGCQTPYLVISACAVAETALASTPPSSLLRLSAQRRRPRQPAGRQALLSGDHTARSPSPSSRPRPSHRPSFAITLFNPFPPVVVV